MEGVKIELALLAPLIDEAYQDVKAKDTKVKEALDKGRLDIARFLDSPFSKGELRKESEQKGAQELEPPTLNAFLLLHYFFSQPPPASSKKKDPATASSPSAGTERCRPQSDTDGQQQLDLSLPTRRGLRKRPLKSVEVPE
ncbi:hypothetical protein HDU78_004500 [Chytriomyces hyalinus]|nr:hypothetical protein HDU78_004500 [Chytriomyces hyalinus]